MPGGRPTKLTAEMVKQLVFHIAKGLPYESVADRCGIHVDTLRSWRNEIEHEFSSDLKNAEAMAEDEWLLNLKTDEKWQRWAWLLERRFRDRWGRHEKVEHTGTVGMQWPAVKEMKPDGF